MVHPFNGVFCSHWGWYSRLNCQDTTNGEKKNEVITCIDKVIICKDYVLGFFFKKKIYIHKGKKSSILNYSPGYLWRQWDHQRYLRYIFLYLSLYNQKKKQIKSLYTIPTNKRGIFSIDLSFIFILKGLKINFL